MGNRIIIFQDEDRIIYWDKKNRGFYYVETDTPNNSCLIQLSRPGWFDLETDEVKAIYDFIEGRIYE